MTAAPHELPGESQEERGLGSGSLRLPDVKPPCSTRPVRGTYVQRAGQFFEWTPEKVAELKALHGDQSISLGEAARRMGVSKNAFLGKAHRLGLSDRANPIKENIKAAAAVIEKANGKDPRGCRFIAGDPSKPDWRYCQEPQRPESPYCEHHHRRCYVRATGEKVAP